MAKVLNGIKGERFPKIGEKVMYSISLVDGVKPESISDTEVKWQLYQANEYNEYEIVNFSGQKIGKEVPYTFLTLLLNRHMKLIVSYKDDSTEMLVIPTQGEAKIVDVFFLDNTGKQLKKIPSYGESIILRVYTVKLNDKNLNFTIYDIVEGKEVEVGKNSKPLKVIQSNGIVKSDLITLNIGMPIRAKQDMSAEVHKYRVKITCEDPALSYEEELKVKNEQVNVSIIPPDVQTPTTVGTAPKKEEEKKEGSESCGVEYRNSITCTRYNKSYGPLYSGSIRLSSYKKLNEILLKGKITSDEKNIILAMSENEGNLDAVQSMILKLLLLEQCKKL